MPSQVSSTDPTVSDSVAKSRNARNCRSPMTRSVTSVTTQSIPAIRLASSYTGL